MKKLISSIETRETDYLIVGAGAMAMAFADEIFSHNSKIRLTIIDKRELPGGHWNDAYPFVTLHQPAAFYGVNSLALGSGGRDLSSRSDILSYYQQIMEKFIKSGRVEYLPMHNYIGEGKVVDMQNPDQVVQYKVRKRLVDATYMKVEVPSTHAPKYEVDEGVAIVPINELVHQYNQWKQFYVIGCGKTGMDAVLFLLAKEISPSQIHWITPNQAWLFNRSHIQVGTVAKEIMKHAECVRDAKEAKEIFLKMEKSGGVLRIDENNLPSKWRCATVNPEELSKLRQIENVIKKGRVNRITKTEIQLERGSVSYLDHSLFVDCSANGLSREEAQPIFSKNKITLQSIMFCQQVFSAATIARLEMRNISDAKRNQLIPVPHPEYEKDWPLTLATSLENLLLTHRYFPLWMFRSRLNFLSHEPFLKYLGYAIKAIFISPTVKKSALKLDQLSTI